MYKYYKIISRSSFAFCSLLMLLLFTQCDKDDGIPPGASFQYEQIDCNLYKFYSTSAGVPTSTNWDFGDGNTAMGDTVIHFFSVDSTQQLPYTDSFEVCLTAVYPDNSTEETCENIAVPFCDTSQGGGIGCYWNAQYVEQDPDGILQDDWEDVTGFVRPGSGSDIIVGMGVKTDSNVEYRSHFVISYNGPDTYTGQAGGVVYDSDGNIEDQNCISSEILIWADIPGLGYYRLPCVIAYEVDITYDDGEIMVGSVHVEFDENRGYPTSGAPGIQPHPGTFDAVFVTRWVNNPLVLGPFPPDSELECIGDD